MVDEAPRRSWVLHVDLDQFLAAVEVLRRPELAGRPVVVGGDGDPARARQVVATASYEARAFGVRSGMPLRRAQRLCPDAVFLPSDRDAYDAASAEVMATLRSFPVVVEVWGWDEAFVGTETDDPEALAQALKDAVLRATRLSCAVGIGESRLLAKTATGRAKPGGVARLTRQDWRETMYDRPVTEVWGIGGRTAARLGALGITTIGELARHDHEDLARHFGPRIGPSLRMLGLGGDESPLVDEPWVPRSRSHETTFEHDIADPGRIAAEVAALADRLTAEVVGDGRRITHVAVKVRTDTFFTTTRVSKVPEPTTDPAEVRRVAALVLGRIDVRHPVRLLGVRVDLEMPA